MAANNTVKNLFIVDNSAVERKLLTGLLQKQWPNYDIWEASDGEEGLSAVEQWMPDLVLMDLCMPQLGGLELLANLRDKQSLVPRSGDVRSGQCGNRD